MTITDATATEAGESLDMRARVTNTGNTTDTQAVQLRCEGVGSDAQFLTLDGGESTTVSFSLATRDSRPGEYTVAVRTDENTDTAQVTLSGPPEFEITDFETTPEDIGGSLDIDVEVTNIGTAAGTQTLELDIEGVDSATQQLRLGGDESRRLSLSIPAAVLDDEQTFVRVSTGDDSVTASVASVGPESDSVEVSPTVACTRCGERFAEGGVQFKQRVYCAACVGLFEAIAEEGVVVRSRHDRDNFQKKPYVVAGGGEQYVEHSQVEALARGKQLAERMETRGLFIFWKHGSHWVLDRYLDEHPEIARDVEGEARKLRGSSPVQPDGESAGGDRIDIQAGGDVDVNVDSFVAEDFVANRSDVGPEERES